MEIDRQEFMRGARDAAPFMLGGVPFGLIVGVAAVRVGYSTALAIANSVIVLAGTAQLAAIQLIELGSTALVIWVTTLFVNIRHMMYSITIAPHFRAETRRNRFLLAFLLHDQAFALSILRFQKDPDLTLPQKRGYFLGVALPIAATWYTSSAVGALLGTGIPAAWSLDFAIPVAFLALIVPSLRDRPTIVAGAVAAFAAVALFTLPFNLGLVLAIVVGMAAGRLAEPRHKGLQTP